MTEGTTFECEDCGNRVEDAPMRVARCLECGGDMTIASAIESQTFDVDDIEVGDWIISEYDVDGRPHLVVAVDRSRERVWVLDAAETSDYGSDGVPSPSYVNASNGVREHIPRGARDDVLDEAAPEAPPQAPMNLPKYLREGADKQSADRLRNLAEYAERLAAWKEIEAEHQLEERAEQDVDETPDEWDDDEWDDVVDDARDEGDVPPGKGTLTTKHIDGRDYYYLQWRAGDKIRSQYVAPVSPASGGSD